MVKNPPVSSGDARDAVSVPGLGRFPGGENGNPLLYSCLGSSMNRGAWWVTVHEVTKCQIQLSNSICTTSTVWMQGDRSLLPLLTEKDVHLESCELSFTWGKMRTVAWEVAHQIALRDCSKASVREGQYIRFW